jgi:hypothetical protein
MDHYEEITKRFEYLGELHHELAELLELLPDPKHAASDHALAEAEERSAETCRRVAASIRTRLK